MPRGIETNFDKLWPSDSRFLSSGDNKFVYRGIEYTPSDDHQYSDKIEAGLFKEGKIKGIEHGKGTVIKSYRPPGHEKGQENYELSPRGQKAEFFLTKIAKLLFPESVADIYSIGKIRERDHIDMFSVNQRIRGVGKSLSMTRRAVGEMFSKAGLPCDAQDGNMKDLKDKWKRQSSIEDTVYIDSFNPWLYNPGTTQLTKKYKSDILRKYIEENLSDEKTKSKALNHLDRIEKLYDEEEKNIEEKRRKGAAFKYRL